MSFTVMSHGEPVAQIDAVDAFARQLYRRAKNAGPDYDDVATIVRRVHTVLKHLKVEAEDDDSLLGTGGAIYARKLTTIVEDCDFELKQLETHLDKYHADGDHERPAKDEEDAALERERTARIRTRLSDVKTNIDIFLDTIQLRDLTKTRSDVVDGTAANLDNIKDKVDAIAAKLFHRRRDSGFSEDGEDLWQQFRYELEKEGFSKDVLSKNKVSEARLSSVYPGRPRQSPRGSRPGREREMGLTRPVFVHRRTFSAPTSASSSPRDCWRAVRRPRSAACSSMAGRRAPRHPTTTATTTAT